MRPASPSVEDQVVDYGFHMATFNGHQGKAIRRASSNIATYCMPSR
jgi:hypothetical protein